jgi:hypothetical protein
MLLVQNPQLAQALLRIQIGFGLVKPSEIASFAAAEPQTIHAQPPMQPPIGFGAAMPRRPPEPIMPMPPPPQAAPVDAAAASIAQLSPEQLAQLERVLSLPPEKIAQLPAHVQAQVEALRVVCFALSRTKSNSK